MTMSNDELDSGWSANREQLIQLLAAVCGEIPAVRDDTPLSALGLRPENIVVLAYQSHIAGLANLQDSDFDGVVTVGELASVCFASDFHG